MKKFNFTKILAMVTVAILFVTSCKKDDDVIPVPEYGIPTISIVSPAIPADGLKSEEGKTISFSIKVVSEAGLSTVSLDDNVIKTYTGKETSDTVKYDYLAVKAGTVTLSFDVQDALGKTANIDVVLVVAEGEDLGYLILDFAGALTSTKEKTVVDWDIRQLYTFDVSGSHDNSATVEVTHTQAQLSFGQDNPDANDNAKVLKLVKTVPDGYDNWNGWPHVIYGLKSVIAEDLITALPKWDTASKAIVAGTKVLKLDVYYDATIDPNFTWDSVISRKDVWNSDPSKGYKIDIALASYDPMGIVESGHDGGFYMGYSEYVGEPNKWVTVTFNLADEGRSGSFFKTSTDKIDCVKLLPSPGYTATDLNPLYMKNLRIVDVAK